MAKHESASPGRSNSAGGPARILIVDDRGENLTVLEALLESLGQPIHKARSGLEALKLLLQHEFAVILLDVQLPDIDGFEAATLIKEREQTRHIPIIFISAHSTAPRHIFQGYSTGAVDYIAKPFNPDILTSKVAVFVDLYLKGEQIKAQAELLRKSELREAERRRLADERKQQRRHLAELAESQARLSQFKATLDATVDCVVIFDQVSHHLVYANRGAVQQLAYSEEELMELTPVQFCTLDDDDFHETLVKIQDGERHALTFETEHVARGGEKIPVEVLVQYIESAGGNPGRFVWIARNIAERKLAEAELAAAYAREKRIAEVLQRSFLMSPPAAAFPGLRIATLYEAAWDEANLGGDFFDAFLIGADSVALVVGDVTGKGLQAAARTAEVKYSLRAFLRDCADPASALGRLNRSLIAQWDGADSHAFVCLSVIVWSASTQVALCSTAGCEPPVVVRNNGGVDIVEARGLPLGIDIGGAYETSTLKIAVGETVVMVTDGITEARGANGLFGDLGFGNVLSQSGESADNLARSILEEAKKFVGGRLQDDACLLVAQVTGNVPRARWSRPLEDGAVFEETNYSENALGSSNYTGS